MRRLRQGQIAEALAAPATGRWSGPLPAADVVRTLPDRLREPQTVFDTTGGVHAAALATADGELLVVREDVGRHNAVDKVTGARVARRAVPEPGVPWWSAAGRASSWSRKRWQRAVGRSSRWVRPPAWRWQLAREAGLALYGFTSGKRTVRYA